MQLSKLLEHIEIKEIKGDTGIDITGIAHNSKQVEDELGLELPS